MNDKTNSYPIAVVTGAANGIGLALSKACINQQYHVVMVDRDGALLSQCEQELKASAQTEILTVECDVKEFDQVEQLAATVFKRFQRLDLLFNNAGISGALAPIWKQSLDQIRSVLDVNLFGVLNGVQAFLPRLIQQEHRSRIVNMASFYGLCSGSNVASYAMSKHAIVALTESIYFDLKRLNKPVDVSVVCPSFVNTKLLSNSNLDEQDSLHEMMLELMKRSRNSDDVAKHIMQEIKKNVFYILPDREIKDYIEQRVHAIMHQMPPHEHNIEKVMAALSRRACLDETS